MRPAVSPSPPQPPAVPFTMTFRFNSPSPVQRQEATHPPGPGPGPQPLPGTHWPHSAPSVRPPPRRDKEALSLPAPRHLGDGGSGAARPGAGWRLSAGWGLAPAGGSLLGQERGRGSGSGGSGNLCTAGGTGLPPTGAPEAGAGDTEKGCGGSGGQEGKPQGKALAARKLRLQP